jgi:hypothetical protein
VRFSRLITYSNSETRQCEYVSEIGVIGISKIDSFLDCAIIFSACTKDEAEQDATAFSWSTLSADRQTIIAHDQFECYL